MLTVNKNGEAANITKIILGMGSANERRRYIVTPPLIDWAHTQNDPWLWYYRLHITNYKFDWAIIHPLRVEYRVLSMQQFVIEENT